MKKFISTVLCLSLTVSFGCTAPETAPPPTGSLIGEVVSGGPVLDEGDAKGNHVGERKLVLEIRAWTPGGASIQEGELVTFTIDPKKSGVIVISKIKTPGVE